MAKRISFKNYHVGMECGGKWFPYVGYGYWDGIRTFLRKPMRLKFRLLGSGSGFAIGPLMFYKGD